MTELFETLLEVLIEAKELEEMVDYESLISDFCAENDLEIEEHDFQSIIDKVNEMTEKELSRKKYIIKEISGVRENISSICSRIDALSEYILELELNH